MASSDQSNWIGELNPSLPAGSEKLSDGDDAIRQVKKAVRDTLPFLIGAVTWSDTQLNFLDSHTLVDGSQVIFDINGLGSPTATITSSSIDMNGKKLKNIGDPDNGTDVGNRTYNDTRYVNQTDFDDYNNLLTFALEVLRQEVHPYLSTYITYDNTNPGNARNAGTSALGFGTWVRVAQGRFLVGIGGGSAHGINRTYSVGNDSSGRYKVQMSINEMPAHSHLMKDIVAVWNHELEDGDGHNHYWHNINKNTEKTGGNQSHENSPPAYGLYIWVRTA